MSRHVVNARPLVAPAGEAVGALRTLRDLMRWAVSRMRDAGVSHGQGTDDPYDEAAWLLLWSLRLPPERLEPFLDASLTPSEIAAAVALVERRCSEREPTAYLLGEAWLHGVRFLADCRALVPRSVIADLLFDGLDDWLGEVEPTRILDLCTGGGSLAVLAAIRHPQARIFAADLSADALALAAENLRLHRLEDRVRLARGDLWEPLSGERFDLVLCNPPYVNTESMSTLPAEFLAEPQSALAGGSDGMDIVRRILAGAGEHLDPAGHLVLEIGHEADHFEAAFPSLEFAWVPVPAGERMVALIAAGALSVAIGRSRPRPRRRASGR